MQRDSSDFESLVATLYASKYTNNINWVYQGVEKGTIQQILKQMIKSGKADKLGIQMTVQCLFSESHPESVDSDLVELITDPTSMVPFLYGLKPK
jgi:hypothetical protein